jgi:hypothetical protein
MKSEARLPDFVEALLGANSYPSSKASEDMLRLKRCRDGFEDRIL